MADGAWAVEVDSPSRWTLAEWQAYAVRYHGLGDATHSYLWASLRSPLAGYPALLSQVPDRPGPVDALSLGTATVHVREGAKPGPVSGSIFITEAQTPRT